MRHHFARALGVFQQISTVCFSSEARFVLGSEIELIHRILHGRRVLSTRTVHAIARNSRLHNSAEIGRNLPVAKAQPCVMFAIMTLHGKNLLKIA